MPTVISFDIDGTLETGDPPGGITMARVRQAVALGHIVGSCSDRTVEHQRRMWRRHGIEAAFTVLKHRLEDVRSAIEAETYVHVGDTHADEYYAAQAGFTYYSPDESIEHLWSPR